MRQRPCVITAPSELRKVLFLAPSVCGFCLYEISREPLNGFAPNSQKRRVWFLDGTSLKVKVIGQRSRSSGIFRHFSALSSASVRFVFGKTSLASSLWSPYVIGRPYIFTCCGLFFFLLPSSFFFSSPNLSGRRLDVYHTLAHGVALVRI